MQKDAMVTFLLRDYAAPIRIVGTVKQNKGKLFLSLPQGLKADTVALTDGSKAHRYTVDREKSLEITVTDLDSVTVFLFHGGTPVAYASREPLSASERKRLVAFINNEPTRKEQDDSAIIADEIDDPYMHEDTTLGDELPIAEYDYFAKEQQKKQPFYFEKIKDELFALLEKFPREQTLEEQIPFSHFACVPFHASGASYAVGYVEENGAPRWLCYAVPSPYYPIPPEALKGFSQFLPKNPHEPFGEGYFLLFESAETGEILFDTRH